MSMDELLLSLPWGSIIFHTIQWVFFFIVGVNVVVWVFSYMEEIQNVCLLFWLPSMVAIVGFSLWFIYLFADSAMFYGACVACACETLYGVMWYFTEGADERFEALQQFQNSQVVM